MTIIMTEERIKELQKTFGSDALQSLIDSGDAWKTAQYIDTEARKALNSGKCFLPKVSYYDAKSKPIPSRDGVAAGRMGSIELASEYWTLAESIGMN